MEVIFENESIKISKIKKDSDILAVVENKTIKEIRICFKDKDKELKNFIVRRNDWTVVFADYTGRKMLKAFESGKFFAVDISVEETEVEPKVGDWVYIKNNIETQNGILFEGTKLKIVKIEKSFEKPYLLLSKYGAVSLWLNKSQFCIAERLINQKIQTPVVGNTNIVAEVDNEDGSIDVAVQVDGNPIITFNISADGSAAYLRKWIGYGDSLDEMIEFSEAFKN